MLKKLNDGGVTGAQVRKEDVGVPPRSEVRRFLTDSQDSGLGAGGCWFRLKYTRNGQKVHQGEKKHFSRGQAESGKKILSDGVPGLVWLWPAGRPSTGLEEKTGYAVSPPMYGEMRIN